MNYLFLLNAGILIFLGPFLFYRNRDTPSLMLLIFNLGVALWSICLFLVNELPLQINVDFISKLQLVASMIFANGLYYFCTSYPVKKRSRLLKVNLLSFAVIAGLILFTDLVSQASVENGVVVYTDHPVGFFVYFLYTGSVTLGALLTLYFSYRDHAEYRDTIKFLYIGVATFMVSGTLFNVILPLLNVYNLLTIGRLSSVFPSLFFAYAITKHDFMDITVIINNKASWFITIILISISYLVVYSLIDDNSLWGLSVMLGVTIFWSVLAAPFQNLLLTSARRKFIRNWYEPEDVISEIADQLTVESDRDSIFNILSRVLDDVFQLEKSLLVLAVRNAEDKITHYEIIRDTELNNERIFLGETPLNEYSETQKKPEFLDASSRDVRHYLKSEGFREGRHCMVVPFYSPEFLEGIIVVGERSNLHPFNERDLRFMIRLTNYISAILYRLTPFERLEQLYFENRERLHEAEIQLIRAQKIEAIVHATRQCHHEIRTPLNIIKLGIGRIKSMEDLESYKTYANEEISRALEIVDETLTITDVSQAEDDRTSSFDINEVIRRSIRVVDLERYQLDMDFQNLPEFYGNFSDMQVVIANLVHNSLDAMPNGGLLAIRTYTRNNSIVIEVEDSGIGIDENLRSRVWEPYFSGKETEVGNSTAGRGWGLTIVNRIVTEHQGTINFTSRVGKGTIFTIILPLTV